MRKQLKGDISLLLVTIAWGTSFPIMSIALKDIPPYSFIAIRYAFAGIILGVFFIKRFKNISLNTIKGGVFVGAALGFGVILQALGLVYTTPSKSGFITGLNVVLVPIFIAAIYKKVPDIKTMFGIIVSVVGLGLMSISGTVGINVGDVLTMFSAVAFAVQIILVDKYAGNVDAALLTIIEFLVIGIMGAVPALFIEGFRMNINSFALGSIVYTALFCTILAYGVQNVAQAYTTPTHAAIIFLAEPVFSAIFSVFIGDKLTGRTFWGALLILIGMIAINIKLNKGEKTNENSIL
jgi:drug/metabolite transporter (DMT)-like permease